MFLIFTSGLPLAAFVIGLRQQMDVVLVFGARGHAQFLVQPFFGAGPCRVILFPKNKTLPTLYLPMRSAPWAGALA